MSPQVQTNEFDETLFETPIDLKCPLTLELFKVPYASSALAPLFWLQLYPRVEPINQSRCAFPAVAQVSHADRMHLCLSAGPSGECPGAHIRACSYRAALCSSPTHH
jgi:hypothetical protein